jgi:integrase
MTTKTRGDGRIFTRTGSAFLWCAYYLRGKEYRESTGTADPVKAAKFLKRRLKEVGADQIGKATFVGPQQERMKVCKLLEALEDDYKLRGKDSPQFRAHLKHVRGYFGAWRAVEVTAEAVDKYISERQEAGSAPATINRSTQLLAQAFKLAIERKHLSNAPQIRHLSEKGNARQGFFADADFHAVRDKLPEYLRDFVQFGYLTGWRKGEIASLRWSDVEGDVVRLRGENAKNGEGRTVTLSGDLSDLIDRRKAMRKVETKTGALLSEYVFHQKGEPVGDFRKAWATACVAAGLGQFVCERCNQTVYGHICEACNGEGRYVGRIFHDFRRTAVRNMVRAGVPERVAMTISGHKTRSIFDRYNIVNEADLREAMRRTQDYLRDGPLQPKRLAPIVQLTAAQG